ncbi:unnamed protein product [Calypogeia fissa]
MTQTLIPRRGSKISSSTRNQTYFHLRPISLSLSKRLLCSYSPSSLLFVSVYKLSAECISRATEVFNSEGDCQPIKSAY